jgi:cobalt-zinc-cadmium efflux system protein
MSTHVHAPDRSELGSKRLGLAVAINLLLTVAQIVGGVVSGSLSLVADALHNFSDAMGLLLALLARKIARRPPDEERTFGYGRAEIVGGLINLTSIVIIAGYLLLEAITRTFDRPEVEGWIIVIVAGIALVVDAATAWLTYSVSKHSMNIKAAFLHNLADALASVAVIVSGTLIILFEWYWTDIATTVGISIYIVWISLPPMKRCIRILMQSTPEEVSLEAVAATIRSVKGVNDVEHVHVWPIDERTRSLEGRLMVDDGMLSELREIRAEVERRVKEAHEIEHITLELAPGSEGVGLLGPEG